MKKKPKKPAARKQKETASSVRSYREIVGLSGPYSDWSLSFLSEDADLWQNNAVMRDRARDLFKTNAYLAKYSEELRANVPGEDGLRLRMKIKEEIDRIVYAADEKQFLDAHSDKIERLREYGNQKGRSEFRLFRTPYNRAKATVQAGQLDLYACTLIENAWREWQRKEFCTVTGKYTYNETRQIRLISAARDGDFFIRKIEDAKINKFGFSLQLINSEWCDFNLNIARLENGNTIRMGIEMDSYGKPVAFHFIKVDPWAWQFGQPGWNVTAAKGHERIPAKEIIHYARFSNADSTRPAPWCAPVMQKIRQLDKFEEAEVIAARAAASKMGVVESDIVPEGGIDVSPDPCKAGTWEMSPGSIQGMPFGMKMRAIDWQHPNGNFENFRKGMLRSICAGLPGADYNVIANDLENINFSAGRLGRLDTNEMWKQLQRFDIETAERPIFEAWLEMALLSGVIKLPYAKYAKYNKPHFSGRRWAGVDVMKEVNAAATAIENKMMSYSQWFDEQGLDLEEVWMEIAEEQMLADDLGLELPKPEGAQNEEPETEEEETEEPAKKPKAKSRRLNGVH